LALEEYSLDWRDSRISRKMAEKFLVRLKENQKLAEAVRSFTPAYVGISGLVSLGDKFYMRQFVYSESEGDDFDTHLPHAIDDSRQQRLYFVIDWVEIDVAATDDEIIKLLKKPFDDDSYKKLDMKIDREWGNSGKPFFYPR